MRLTIIVLSLSFSAGIIAQGIGLHPPEVNWRQLRGDHARIFFPEGYEDRAQRVASMIDWMAENHTDGVGDRLYDFDLVLQTPNMTINGYVGLGPFRSEFYVTPPQSFSLLSQTEWVDLLTIHEFRHVQQNSNERRGLTKLISYLQGQQGWSVFSSLATPNWYSEGDAVITETALSAAGRGRTPAFSKDLRSLLNADEVYTYQKARNGSFRDLVPDHYRYGYGMLTYARERYGNEVWKNVLHEGAAYRSPFYSFSRALKRATGNTTRQLYRATMQDLSTMQDSALQASPPTAPGEVINAGEGRDIRDYRFPFTDGEGRLIALRSSYRQLPALVAVTPGKKDKIITPIGIQREPWIDGGDRLVVWTESRQHPRYTNRQWSDLILYDLKSGTRRKLTGHGHYVSARLNPDETELVAVWLDPLAGKVELHIIDVASGGLTARKLVDAGNVSWPDFSPDGKLVYFLSGSRDGVAVNSWNPASGAVTSLRPASYSPIDMLSVDEDGVLLLTLGGSGTDNVYSFDPASASQIPLTDVAIGAYYPYRSGDTLYFSVPTPHGQRLAASRLSSGENGLIELGPYRPNFFQRPAAFSGEVYDLPNEIEERKYPTENFSNTLGGIKLHSWSYNGSYVTPGLGIEFANALNTFELSIDGLYNFNEDRYSGGATLTYGGLFPVIQLTGNYRARNTVAQEARTDSLRFFVQEFDQLTMGSTVTVPLQWVAGNMVTTFAPSAGFQYYDLGDAEEGVLPRNFANVSLGIGFSALRRTSVRQVQSRLGAVANLAYDRALGSSRAGERLRLRSSVFLPSVFHTHGIRLDLDVQREQAENLFQYPDVFQYARGFDDPLNDRVFRLGANYQLPLLYPDFGILGITYFKRLRLNAFYDYSRFAIDAFEGLEFTERSVGGQFYFDNVWLNAAPLTFGMELAYRLDRDIFSVDGNDVQFRLLVSGGF